MVKKLAIGPLNTFLDFPASGQCVGLLNAPAIVFVLVLFVDNLENIGVYTNSTKVVIWVLRTGRVSRSTLAVPEVQ